MNRLTVGYSALANRVAAITPPTGPYDLLLVVQNDKNIAWQDKLPQALRDSAVTDELKSLGVAKSRNRVIELANTDYLVFADDDIEFVDSGLNEVTDYLDAHQGVALVLAQAVSPSGQLRKPYPSKKKS
jgi:glycosyltransferase involved in cell wall biosynthesis